MSLEEKILNDYKSAMKAKDNLRSSALSFLRAELKNHAIELKKKELGDKEVIEVIKRQVKRLKEAIDQFKIGKRQDLVDKESKGLEVLQGYLPKQMSEEEIKKIVEEIISAKGEVSIKDMGSIMKEVMVKSKGAADGKTTSEIVKQRLSQGK